MTVLIIKFNITQVDEVNAREVPGRYGACTAMYQYQQIWSVT